MPLAAATGPPPSARRSEAQPCGAPLGQGRCRADPPPARLSVWARGEGREGGHRHQGGRTTRACPPALPARLNAGRLLLVEELGQAGRRRRHPSAGGPAAGIALRRVSAAGSRGLAHGSGGDHTGRPLRQEARVAAQPSAAAAVGRVAEGREGGGRGPALETTALPPPPPPPGWRRRDRQPPATEPALPEGCGHRRGRPALCGAPKALAGPEGGAGGAPGPAPPGRRARSLPPPPAPARREGPTRRGSPAALPCVLAEEGWLPRTCSGQDGWGAPGPARDGPGGRAWQRTGCTATSEQHQPRHTLAIIYNHQTPRARGKACALF